MQTVGIEAETATNTTDQHLGTISRREALEKTAKVVWGIAHEYSNILTGIMGFAELAMEQLPTQSIAHRHVSEILEAARAGAQWTHQLRLFGRPSASATGLCSLSAYAGENNRPLHKPKATVRLRLAIPADLPPLRIGEESLLIVLNNLLVNADEAVTHEGEIGVTAQVVELHESDVSNYFGNPTVGPNVEIRVTDTGCGMTPATMENLFVDPFFSSKGRKRGMGLALVFGIVAAHRGGVRAESSGGQGTSVHVVLPIAAQRGPVPAEPTAVLPGKEQLYSGSPAFATTGTTGMVALGN